MRCGGGVNHRIGLFDAVLIKDNHIVAAGGVGPAHRAARGRKPGTWCKIEVEVDTLDELDEALQHDPDAVLLDNMDVPLLRAGGRARLPAAASRKPRAALTSRLSRAIAETGVDLISVGALTHSAPVLDLGLDFDPLT